MDSAQSTEIVEQPVAESPETRLQRLVPVVRSLAGKVKTLSVASAGSALVLWWIWFDPHLWLGGVSGQWVAISVVVLLALLIPAAAAFVGYRTLQEILNLPGKLKESLAETQGQAKEVATSGEISKRGRLLGFFKTIWSARSLIIDSQGAWGKAIAAVRLARLASLPFVLGLLVTFALNFVLIAVTVVAVGFSVVF